MATSKWKPLLEEARDASLGATLMRLARQAAAMHLYETTHAMHPRNPRGDEQVRAVGDGTQLEFDAATRGRIDTEVNR